MFLRYVLASFLTLLALAARAADAAPLRIEITKFGAEGDDRTVSTQAIQQTIDHVAKAGGGTVVIPEGVYTTGALFFKPGVNLHLDRDAVLRGSTFIEDYPKTMTRIEGHFEEWRPALLNFSKVDGLRITGEGMLDGSGQAFWQLFWKRLAADNKTKNLDIDRPRLMFVDSCTNVVISGITLKDSGFWNMHLYRCREVLVEKVTINSPIGAPSTDGIDIDSCQNVTVRGCSISVDDDCIAIKGSKGPLALEDKDSPPVEHIRVNDCTFNLGHGVVTLGSEATIVRDVVVENCRVVSSSPTRTNSVVRLKMRPDTPQTYEDIHFNNIVLEGYGKLLSIEPWTQYFDLKGHPRPNSTVRNITARNITGSYESIGSIKPHDHVKVSDITLENINLKLKNDRLRLGDVENLVIRNVIVNGKPLANPNEK
ncbi:MAG: glycosyl hydrolase family 28 protein [Nibricoccus sp.]